MIAFVDDDDDDDDDNHNNNSVSGFCIKYIKICENAKERNAFEK
jgi:hypothetical protein